jgi:hypothetical protein
MLDVRFPRATMKRPFRARGGGHPVALSYLSSGLRSVAWVSGGRPSAFDCDPFANHACEQYLLSIPPTPILGAERARSSGMACTRTEASEAGWRLPPQISGAPLTRRVDLR